MKKCLFLFLLTLASGSAFSQRKATFNSLIDAVVPFDTKIRELKERFTDVAIDTTIGPHRIREIYFKRIGIGFMGDNASFANYLIVHLKETDQQSDEYHFKRNITVNDLYKKMGEPDYFIYEPAENYIKIIYKGYLAYEIYNAKLKKGIAETDKESFAKVFPAVKKLKPDYLFIDLASDTPPPVEELMIEEIEQDTTGN